MIRRKVANVQRTAKEEKKERKENKDMCSVVVIRMKQESHLVSPLFLFSCLSLTLFLCVSLHLRVFASTKNLFNRVVLAFLLLKIARDQLGNGTRRNPKRLGPLPLTDMHYHAHRVYFVDGTSRARELGDVRTLNMFMLGCLSFFVPLIKVHIWKDSLRQCLPSKLQEINLTAFDRGRKEIRGVHI